MTPVIVDSSARNAGGSGNTGWSARSVFQRPTNGIGIIADNTVAIGSASFGRVSTTSTLGQSFTPGHAMSVTAISVMLWKSGSPTDNVTVEIRNNTSNAPGSTVLGTSDPIAATALTTISAWWNLTFSSPVSLSSGTKYWMTLQRSGGIDASNYPLSADGVFLAYAGGDKSTYNGTSWTLDTNRDIRFRVIESIAGSQPLYQITQDSSLHAWKSTDDGATWTEQDAAHAPSVNSSTSSWSAHMSVWSEIAVAYFSGTNTLRARVFNAFTDLWDSDDLAGANATTDADPLSPVRIGYRDAYMRTFITYTSIADTADISLAKRSSSTWATQAVLAATSAERSIVSDMPLESGVVGYGYPIYYDTANDDASFTSISINAAGTASVWTELDLDTTVATTEASHASAVFQVYDNGSGVDKIIAAFIDSDDSLQERTMLLGDVSTSVTLGTQHQVTATTSYAGRHLATCKYGSDLYVFASTGSTIVYYKDTGASGTWGSAVTVETGLTSAALSTALSVTGLGILISYTDNGNVVIDWAVGGPVGSSTITKTATPVTVALQSTSTRTATSTTASLSLTKTRTATPITVALQATNTRTATSTTAALISTRTRTATATVALTGTLTRTATATAALTATRNRTATPVTASLYLVGTRTATPTTAALIGTLTRTATATAALTSTRTRTATPVTIALAGTLTRTASASVALKTTATRTATATVALGTGGTRTASPVTLALTGTLTRTAPATIATGITGTRTAPATASLYSLGNRTATPVTASLYRVGTRTATASTSLIVTPTRTAPADMAMSGVLTLTAPATMAIGSALDGRLHATLSQQPVLSATITHERTIDATLSYQTVLSATLEVE